MSPLRTVIIGYGRSGRGLHAGPISRNPAFRIIAVCDIDEAARGAAQERHGCAVYSDHHEMLRKEKPDLAIVVTYSHQHCRMACDCLDAGTNVVVTKPWGLNAAEGERMIAAARRSGKKLLPWLPMEWACDLKRLRALMAEKAIGDVFMIRRAVASFALRHDWQTLGSHGGGYLLNWGPHIVEPTYILLQSPVVSVYACMKQVINPGDVEDVFHATMNLANGAVAIAEYTISAEPIANWLIQGTRGTIRAMDKNLVIHSRIPKERKDPTSSGSMQPYALMDAFDATVTEEKLTGNIYGDETEIYGDIARELQGEAGAYRIDLDRALTLTRVLDAIRLSARENRLVTLA